MPISVGDIELLPGDPAPPEVPIDARLRDLDWSDLDALCMWLILLDRPNHATFEVDCPGHDVYGWYNLDALINACYSGTRPACDATVRDVLRCAVAVKGCDTTASGTPACRAFGPGPCEASLPNARADAGP